MLKNWQIILFLLAIPSFGTVGYMLVEDWKLLDAVYMSIITISTVGYQEVLPLSDAGRVFTIFYLVIGLSSFLYTIGALGEKIVHDSFMGWFGNFNRHRGRRKMQDHYIICGAGRFGCNLAEDFEKRGYPFVIVDKSPNQASERQKKNWKWVIGDATDDNILKEAGIEKAKGIATVLGSDADNLYVTLSSRIMRKDIQIVSRASDQKTTDKLKMAGADKVVSLYKTGAVKMAELLSNTKMSDFVEIFAEGESEMDMAEFPISSIPELKDKKLDATDLRDKGLIVIGVRQSSGIVEAMPNGSRKLQETESIITVGLSADIKNFSTKLK